MNAKYLLLPAIILVLACSSCKKTSQTPPSGSWQETKIVMWEDSDNVKLYDTTYLKPFNSVDFARLYQNGTIEFGSDHDFSLNIPHQNDAVQQVSAEITTWNYTKISTPAGVKFVLSLPPAPPNPGDFDTADTVTLINANTLLLHAVLYAHVPGISTVSDSYYTKQ